MLALALGAACSTEPKRDPPFDGDTALMPGEEFAYGRSIAARVCADKELVEDRRVREYVARVGGTVAAASARPDPYDGWRFYVVRDATVSTFSAPCGFVFITTGALKASKSEDVLAAMLAQEMAHSALDHALEGEPVRDIRPTRESWPYASPGAAKIFHGICDGAARRATGGWTEEQELAASAWAQEALKRAGYETGGTAPEIRTKRWQEELEDLK